MKTPYKVKFVIPRPENGQPHQAILAQIELPVFIFLLKAKKDFFCRTFQTIFTDILVQEADLFVL